LAMLFIALQKHGKNATPAGHERLPARNRETVSLMRASGS